MAQTTANEAQGVNSVETGAQVLRALERGRGPMSLTAVARGSDLHPAKAHRYLVSLIRSGLAIQHEETGRYDLGPGARELGMEALRRTDAVSLVSTHAVALRDRSGHTVNVSVWTDLGATMVRWDTGSHALSIVIQVGSSLPLLHAAVGMVFLTYLPASITRPVLARQRSADTVRRPTTAEIQSWTEETRAGGYARTRDEIIFGLGALAAPVFGAGGALKAAIGVIVPGSYMTDRRMRALAKTLTATADSASHDLGYVPEADLRARPG